MSISEKIKVGQTGRYNCDPDWRWNKKGAPGNDFDLWVVTGGAGLLTTGDVSYGLSAGDVFLLRGWDDYFGRADRTRPITVVFIHFDYIDGDGTVFKPSEDALQPLRSRLYDFPFFLKLLDRVLECRLRGLDGEAGVWLACALEDIRYQNAVAEEGAVELAPVERFIDSLARKIQSSPESSYHLPEIASDASYSTDHFSKLFKARVGMPFRDFVIQSRIEAAKLHLRSSSAKISKIAEALGYSDLFLFSKQFKKKCGMTPTKYREHNS
ncbi:MAG: helix-turn-helix transcriptional regulator [Kiritimatiellaeota bacterium]|nr:helix-turn-helix transcriptional regulator [Kiritimatiellota bacterium]